MQTVIETSCNWAKTVSQIQLTLSFNLHLTDLHGGLINSVHYSYSALNNEIINKN